MWRNWQRRSGPMAVKSTWARQLNASAGMMAWVMVKPAGQEAQTFDDVVFACHSDQALALMDDPGPG